MTKGEQAQPTSADALCDAARRGDERAVRYMLEAEADPNARDRWGFLPLHAAMQGIEPNQRVVHTLLEVGAHVNAQDRSGQTALHIVWDARVAAALLRAGASVGVSDAEGQTPLHVAAERLQAGVVRALVGAGADANGSDRSGRTPLHNAITSSVPKRALPEAPSSPGRFVTLDYSRYRAALEALAETVASLLAAGAGPNAPGPAGRTPLMLALDGLFGAAHPGVADWAYVVGVLLDAGADPNAAGPEGASALHVAAASDLAAPEVLPALLESGADVEARDGSGRTPLALALEAGVERAVALLANAGAKLPLDAIVKTPHPELALYAAALQGNATGVRAALAAGADIDALSRPGCPLLRKAVQEGNEVAVRLLLDAGADPDGRNATYTSPLHVAIERGDGPVLEALLAAGADPNRPRTNGETPLHLAVRYGRRDAAGALLAAGADAGAAYGRGQRTVLVEAVRAGDAWLVRALTAAGANLEATSSELGFEGATALHRAAAEGAVAAVRALLDAGADATALDSKGRTPRLRAEAAGHSEVLRILREA